MEFRCRLGTPSGEIVEGVYVAVIGREDQLRNKRATDRPKDKLDADWLEQMRKPSE